MLIAIKKKYKKEIKEELGKRAIVVIMAGAVMMVMEVLVEVVITVKKKSMGKEGRFESRW